jgi:hypothetical protein
MILTWKAYFHGGKNLANRGKEIKTGFRKEDGRGEKVGGRAFFENGIKRAEFILADFFICVHSFFPHGGGSATGETGRAD